MITCNHTKKLIDEADRPERLPLEASSHIALCEGCKVFASERAGLRELIGSSARVTAPANFDALLRERIDASRARGPFAWLGGVGYMRLGAATAVLLVAVFAGLYSGFFSSDRQATTHQPVASAQPTETASTLQTAPTAPASRITPVHSIAQTVSVGGRRAGGRRMILPKTELTDPDLAGIDPAVVILRGPEGERELPMPAVSVGAQPLMYVGAGRQTGAGTRTSF
jgi:hypothetical protein